MRPNPRVPQLFEERAGGFWGARLMARVTVIIPVFNSARTLRPAIESVLAQNFTDFELVCVDDGSSDASRSILHEYVPRIRVLEQENRGPSAARNLALRNSEGEYVALLDADDWWMPDMLEKLVTTLDADRRSVLAYCDLQIVDSLGRELDTSLAATHSSRAPSVEDMLERLWPIMPSGVVMRRAALEAAGGFPEQLRAFEDVYLWLLMREQGTFIFIPEKLAVWRFALFPDALKPGGGQEEAGKIFRRMVRERYGVDPIQHVRSRRRAPRSILGYIGLRALAEGDRLRARAAFGRALGIDPLRLRNYLRWLRTYLPAGIARKLSSRRRRARRSVPQRSADR